MQTSHYLFASILGFLAGSLMFSLWLPKLLRGVDVRADAPDENPGVYNVFAKCGRMLGIACLLCDLLKGFLPVYLAAQTLDVLDIRFALVLASPVLGHCYSPFLRFQGGKGICTSFGVLLGLLPALVTVALLVFWYLLFSLVVVIQPHSLRTIATFLLLAVSACFFAPKAVAWGCALFSAAVIHKNLRRPIPQEERMVSFLKWRAK
ncbi:MAG: glycerol-3-phosphate acyltransferase [Firmicutes bacterium]|nr:glycerol-3-phosphate acyltransferase [Bacillota bacterium]